MATKLLADTFVKIGGTSSEFLKADGSVDNNRYFKIEDTVIVTDEDYVADGTESFILVQALSDNRTIELLAPDQTGMNSKFLTIKVTNTDGYNVTFVGSTNKIPRVIEGALMYNVLDTPNTSGTSGLYSTNLSAGNSGDLRGYTLNLSSDGTNWHIISYTLHTSGS